jgi:uncharacterized protein DUF4232
MHFLTCVLRRLAGVAAVAVAAALIPAAALAATAAGGAAGQAVTPQCTTAGLVVWMDTNGNGAAGSIFYTLKFTNLSGHACTLFGHPGVIAVNLNGARLGHAARWDPPAPGQVRLANGGTATAVLQYSDVVTANNHCQAAAAGLRVRPPGQTASKVIPFPFTACTNRTLVYLAVQPVKES